MLIERPRFRYAHLRFVDIEAIKKVDGPLTPADFFDLISKQCFATRDILRKECVRAFERDEFISFFVL